MHQFWILAFLKVEQTLNKNRQQKNWTESWTKVRLRYNLLICSFRWFDYGLNHGRENSPSESATLLTERAENTHPKRAREEDTRTNRKRSLGEEGTINSLDWKKVMPRTKKNQQNRNGARWSPCCCFLRSGEGNLQWIWKYFHFFLAWYIFSTKVILRSWLQFRRMLLLIIQYHEMKTRSMKMKGAGKNGFLWNIKWVCIPKMQFCTYTSRPCQLKTFKIKRVERK